MYLSRNVGILSEADSGRSWNPTQLAAEVRKRVANYSAFGLQRSDRVLITFGNRLEFFAELLSVWQLGACAIPVDARLTEFEMRKLSTAAAARFAIVDQATAHGILSAVADLTVFYTDAHQDIEKGGTYRRVARLDDDALILFTSGSTGQPKGVVHTHRSLLARWLTLRDVLGTDAYVRTLCLLPTHFGHGLICNCLFPWFAGCDLVIARPFRPNLLMQLGDVIDEHRISFLSSVPSVWNLVLRAGSSPELGTLRRIHVGSAPLSASLWGQIQDWSATREVFNAYGITETGSWVAGTTGGPFTPTDGLIGEPWGSTIRIMEARSVGEFSDRDTDCRSGKEGMIWLRTPALMKEYFQLPELTEKVITDGWFMTGDIGAIDEEGRLVILGRERDEINKGGMKIFPADIDAVAADAPGLIDACAFGIEDPFYFENVAIAVVLHDRKDSTIAAVYDHLGDHLSEHKRPMRWYILSEIPRTSRGKINREMVRERCADTEPVNIHAVLSDRQSRG